MRLLVSGGAGFLGSHLCKKLLDQDNQVVCLDNLVTGNMRNIQELIERPNFRFIHQDVTLSFDLEVDGIYNLACPASPLQYQRNPVSTMITNIKGAINVLELARNRGIPVLQASTSEIYGDPLVNPQKENYWGNVNPIGMRSCYDEGKRAAETLFTDYARQFGVEVRIARIFNTYGPHMDPHDGRVVSNFVVQALTNKPITIFGDGSQVRSLCYVSDLIEGLTALFSSSFQTPVNLGNPDSVTMFELATEVLALTNSNSKIIFKDLPSDDPKIRKPDISLANSILKWSPNIDRKEGLLRTIRYFDELGIKNG